MNNPWNITPAEFEAIQKTIETGQQSIAAKKLGKSPATIQQQVSSGLGKIGYGPLLPLYIKFDRWHRQQ